MAVLGTLAVELFLSSAKYHAELEKVNSRTREMAGSIEGSAKATNALQTRFENALNPTVKLGAQISALEKAGKSSSDIFAVYGNQIRNATDVAEKHGQAIPDIVKKYKDMGSAQGAVNDSTAVTLTGWQKLSLLAAGVSSAINILRTAFDAAKKVLDSTVLGVVSAGDEFLEMSQKTGVSVETLSSLRTAADTSGTSMEGVAKAAGYLSRNMYESTTNNKAARDAFNALGISVKNADGSFKSVDTVLMEISDKFRTMPDGPTKTAAAMTLMGRSGAEVIPMLNTDLRAMIDLNERLGLTISTQTAVAADNFNDSLGILQLALTGVGYQIGSAMIPVFQWLIDVLIGLMGKLSGNNELLRDMAGWFAAPVLGALGLGNAVLSLGLTLMGFYEKCLEVALGLDGIVAAVNPLYQSAAPELKQKLIDLRGSMVTVAEGAAWCEGNYYKLKDAVDQVGTSADIQKKHIKDFGGDNEEAAKQAAALAKESDNLREKWEKGWIKQAADEAAAMERQTKAVTSAFQAQLKPADDLENQISTLLENGFSQEQIVAVWRDRILEVTRKHEELNGTIPLSLVALRAFAAQAKIDATETLPMLRGELGDLIATMPDASGSFETMTGAVWRNKKEGESWGEVWRKQVSTIVTDLSEGIARAIVEWQGFWNTLKSIAEESAVAIIRTVVEKLINGLIGKLLGEDEDALGGVLNKAGEKFKGFASSIGSALSNGLSAVGGFISSVGSSILGALGPAGTIIAGAVAGIALIWRAFKKDPIESGAKEAIRDFGMAVGESAIQTFLPTAGLNKKTFEPIRKDILSSPKFFQDVLLPYAQNTGQVEALIQSFGSVATAWGTFDFSEGARKAIETGDYSLLNQQYYDAFSKSQALMSQYGGDLSRLYGTVGAPAQTAASASDFAYSGEGYPAELGNVYMDLNRRVGANGLLDIPEYAVGGYVPRNTFAYLHGGEYVLPASVVARMSEDGGNNGAVHVHLEGANIYGIDQLDEVIATAVERTYRRGGLSQIGTKRELVVTKF